MKIRVSLTSLKMRLYRLPISSRNSFTPLSFPIKGETAPRVYSSRLVDLGAFGVLAPRKICEHLHFPNQKKIPHKTWFSDCQKSDDDRRNELRNRAPVIYCVVTHKALSEKQPLTDPGAVQCALRWLQNHVRFDKRSTSQSWLASLRSFWPPSGAPCWMAREPGFRKRWQQLVTGN